VERNKGRNRVVPLDDLDDYEVAEGDPDIEGWEVIASDGKEIGKIKNLLADASAMKVRYIDVDLDRDLVRDRDDSHVLIPVGQVRVIEEDKRVMAESMSSSDVVGLPAYTGGPVTREYESTLRQRFERGYEHGSVSDDDFYSADIYDTERFYGRGVGAGAGSAGEVPGGRRRVETVRPSERETPRRDDPLGGEASRGERHRDIPREGKRQDDRDDPLPGRSGPPPDRDRDF
jgi:photosynthetic reaction center H subunit